MREEILHLSQNAKHEKLPSLVPLATEVAAAGLKGTLLLRDQSEASAQEETRRRHDIAAALRTLKLTVDALKDGYQFDDPAAGAKIKAIEKAVTTLTREGQTLRECLL